jgi:hypothetical protein
MSEKLHYVVELLRARNCVYRRAVISVWIALFFTVMMTLYPAKNTHVVKILTINVSAGDDAWNSQVLPLWSTPMFEIVLDEGCQLEKISPRPTC